MHAAVGAKQGPGGTGELNERSVLENVPPWGLGATGLCGRGELRPSRLPFQGQALELGACASGHHLLSDLEAVWSFWTSRQATL